MRLTGKKILGIGLILFFLLILISLIKFGSIIGFFVIYPWMRDFLGGAGVNPFLAKSLAIGSTIAVWAIIFRLIFKWGTGEERFLMFSKRTWGIILLVGIFMLQGIGMFFVTREENFSREGTALRYYTRNPISGEILLKDHPGYDAFGLKAEPITPEIAKELALQKMYPQAEVSQNQIKNFFDRRTGKPLVYYYQDENGTCHFYACEGYSPQTGKKLAPVTEGVLEKCDGTIEARKEEQTRQENEKQRLEKRRADLKKREEDLRATRIDIEKQEIEKREEIEKKRLEIEMQERELASKQENLLNARDSELEILEKQKAELEEKAGNLNASLDNLETQRNELDKEKQRLENEKRKIAKEKRRLEKEREIVGGQRAGNTPIGGSYRSVTGKVRATDSQELEILLDLSGPATAETK